MAGRLTSKRSIMNDRRLKDKRKGRQRIGRAGHPRLGEIGRDGRGDAGEEAGAAPATPASPATTAFISIPGGGRRRATRRKRAPERHARLTAVGCLVGSPHGPTDRTGPSPAPGV